MRPVSKTERLESTKPLNADAFMRDVDQIHVTFSIVLMTAISKCRVQEDTKKEGRMLTCIPESVKQCKLGEIQVCQKQVH